MRQIICENNQAPLAPPAAPKTICKNPPCPNHNNQSEQEENLTVSPAHAAGSAPPPTGANSKRTQWQTCKQALNKQAIRKQQLTVNRSRQKKTNEEKQAKKKELDRCGEGLWRGKTWKLHSFKFLS